MEPSRFDDLTKTLATATSRRQALKTIAATTLGGILGLAGIGTAFAAKNCKKLGQGCNTKKNLCCPGLICQGGVCVAPVPPCLTADTCCPDPTTCQEMCCTGQFGTGLSTCSSGFACARTSTCGDRCGSDNDCSCGGPGCTCVSGICTCVGESCTNGVCL